MFEIKLLILLWVLAVIIFNLYFHFVEKNKLTFNSSLEKHKQTIIRLHSHHDLSSTQFNQCLDNVFNQIKI